MILLDLYGEIIQCDSSQFLTLLKELIIKTSSIQEVSEKIGVGRESLYKSLSKNGNPNFFTILKIVKSLGMKIEIKK